MELKEIKQYLRLEEEWDEDDSLISSFIGAAKIAIFTSTGKKYNPTNDLHKLAVQLFVVHQYDNRTLYTVDKHKDLSYSLKTMLTLIAYGDENYEA